MTLDLSHKGLTTLKGIELSNDIRKIHLQYNHLKDVTNVRFPEGLQVLYLDRNLLENLDNVRFPDGLRVLYLDWNRLSSLENIQFPEGLLELWLHQNQLSSLDNLYISPATTVISDCYDKIREAVRLTCTRAIFGTPSVNPISLGAWWARVSYLTGGVTYLTLDEAL